MKSSQQQYDDNATVKATDWDQHAEAAAGSMHGC